MKNIYIVIGLIVVAGLVWFFAGDKDANTPEMIDEAEVATEVEATDEMEELVEDTPMAEESDVAEEIPATTEEAVSTEKVFTLDSFNFGYSETEIRVKQGDTVTINLTNSDGFHDWVVDEFSAATEKIREGGETSVTFVADQTGTFEYYCSVGSHRANGMVGNLIVE